MSSLLEHFSLGQVDGMREALARGEDVNQTNESNQTLLMFAAASNCFGGINPSLAARILKIKHLLCDISFQKLCISSASELLYLSRKNNLLFM